MNSWIHLISALVTAIAGTLITFDWSGVVGASPHTVGVVLIAAGAIKAAAETISPSAPVPK